jgi:ADP-ribosylglycohydrolase
MRYSLLSQFQGTLLGAVLGEFIYQELSIFSPSKQESDNLADSQQITFQEVGNNRAIHRTLRGEIAIISARSLVKYEGLELEDWQENWTKWKSKKLSEYPNSGVSLRVVSEIAIASLPVAMLYHEEEAKLREKLDKIGEVWQGKSDVKLSNLAVGYAIALALKEKLEPQTLITQIINILEEECPLVELLKEVQSLLERRADLETAIRHLSNKAKSIETEAIIPVCLAFYCFLSTPENWQLAVQRAARTGRGSQICAIVGALSGAYNSSAGIPVEWRGALNFRLRKTSGLISEAVASEAEIIELAKTLLAIWCGVYNPKTMENKLNLVPAVAASNVIRPR